MTTSLLPVTHDSLVYLGSLLEALPTDESADTIEQNLELVNRVAERNYIVPLLEEILGNPSLLAEVASRSYRHVNYFDKVVLVGSDKLSGYRLTLHLWCPPFTQAELKKESLHDHRFSFWSAILVGVLRSENFKESPDGELMQHYRYIPEKRGLDAHNFYEFVGDVKLIRAELIERHVSQSYYQPFVGVHRVLLPDSLTCTLVLRGARQKSFTNTYRTDVPKVNMQVQNAMFSIDELGRKLRALLAAIHSE